MWIEVKRLYLEDNIDPRQIAEELKQNKYFDESIIPEIEMIYYYISHRGWAKEKKQDQADQKALIEELNNLKQKLSKTRHQKQIDTLVEAFKTDELSIDDITFEKIAEMKLLMQELVNDARKKEDGKINVDKLSKAMKLLDTWTNTLIKARVLEDKATDKVDVTVKESVLDKMRENYLDETIDEVEKTMKDSGTVENE